MGVNIMSIVVVSSIVGLIGLQYWTKLTPENYKADDFTVDHFIPYENLSRAMELQLGSYTSFFLVAIFALNVFAAITLGLKTIFFSVLYTSEIKKTLERLANYIIYKGTFLPLVVPPTVFQAGLWSIWLGVLCCLKMFQALARDRLERLNDSPSATPRTYFRAYSALLFVLSLDLLWIVTCFSIYRAANSYMYILLFFEPLSIAFETLQAIVVHGFQLLEICLQAGDISSFRFSKRFDVSPAGSLGEWKGILVRNLGFFLDMMTMIMALSHYLHIWWLHGIAFHLVDAILFMNIRALLSAIVKRTKMFIKLHIALGTLDGALPGATYEELRAYDDECAICREPMAKAKKLPCKHLFHLVCLRSWLDQGLNENYSCPTCRKPLFAGRAEPAVNAGATEDSRDEQLARQLSTVLDRSNLPGHGLHPGAFANPSPDPEIADWRRTGGADGSWLGSDEAGPSGLNRMQMVMRQLAAVGETYAQTALEDTAWTVFPPNASQASTSRPAARGGGSIVYDRGSGSARAHARSASHGSDENLADIIAMAEAVRDVLPHIPDDLIFQDLQRTHSATVTVNNLLQM